MADKSTRKTVKKHPNGEESAAPPPAYFLSLTVKNFRCFGPEQTLDLSNGNGRPAQWTVILGDNGVGKTTLLQSLAWMQPKSFSQGTNNLISDDDTLHPLIFFFFDFTKDDYLDIRSLWGWGTSMFLGSSLIQDHAGKQATFYAERLSATNSSHAISFQSIYKLTTDVSGLICYGYGASRRMDSGSLSESNSRFRSGGTETCVSLFDDSATLINAEEWLLQADYAANKEGLQQSIARIRRDQIKDILVALLPDVTDIRISQAKTGFSSFVEVKTPYGWVPIQGLSLGYRSLISWMVDFASRLFDRYPDSENPLAEPAVCLVDEIDLHLHPRWQRTLMSFLSGRFPNTQFIATAHSPLVVQAAQNANIVVLRREGDHVVIDNDVEAIKNWRIDQVLTSDLFGLPSARPPQLDDAMKERQKILSKARLTKADRARLAELEANIGELPTGETPEDIEAMDIIHQAAKILQNGKDTAP